MIFFKKILYNFLEFFKKKEYYITNYNTLNAYDINFKTINDDNLIKIKNIILNFKEADCIDNAQLNFFVEDALQFSDLNSLIIEIRKIINDDYKSTYFEAINHNWNFMYYLSDSDNKDKQTLFIKNEIKKTGAIIYALLAIRKFKNHFYLWNLLE